MLRIGFDAKRLFNNFTGLGNYSRTLVQNLSEQYPDHQYYLYSPQIQKKAQTNYFLESPGFIPRQSRYLPDTIWRSFGLRPQIRKDEIGLYHGLSNELPYNLRNTGVKTIVTIHDLIFKRYPKWYPLIDRQIYDLKFRYSCQTADRIIAISECTKKDIIHFYDVDPSRISVIYQTCGSEFQQLLSDPLLALMREKYKLPQDYLLYVGSVIERKNLMGIINALSLLPSELDIPLVVIGQGKGYLKQVKAEIARKGLTKQVYFLSDLQQSDLPALYQAAMAFLYPSHYEGFGIPLIESLFSRTPVLTANRSSLPEAAGEGGHYVDPAQAEDIAAGIEKLIEDSEYRKTLTEKGLAHIQRFDVEKSTAAVMDLYQDCLDFPSLFL